jgi:hypothetical protein
LAARVRKVPAAEWFAIVLGGHKLKGMRAFFVHPVTEPAVIWQTRHH